MRIYTKYKQIILNISFIPQKILPCSLFAFATLMNLQKSFAQNVTGQWGETQTSGWTFTSNSNTLTISGGSGNTYTVGYLKFQGDSTVFTRADRTLTITVDDATEKLVTIQSLTNPYIWSGVGFDTTLDSQVNTRIDSLQHSNYTGGSNINIKTGDYDLDIGSINFTTNGIYGSQGVINLSGKNINIDSASGGSLNTIIATATEKITGGSIYFGSDIAGSPGTITFNAGTGITITNLSGRQSNTFTGTTTTGDILIKNLTFVEDICITDSCGGSIILNAQDGDVTIEQLVGGNTSEQGIRAGNSVTVSGNNFYGGTIYAIGLPTAGSNSTLDFTGVTGTSFIHEFQIRTGTLKGSDFHINNFTVWKSNSWSAVSSNIGKSFINSLILEIGTLGGIDNADLTFNGGGDILNINYLSSASSSSLKFNENSGINLVNINEMKITNSELWAKDLIVNTLVATYSTSWATGIPKIEASAMNINELLQLQEGSTNGGRLQITLTGTSSDGNNQQTSYLSVDVDSTTLKNMSASEIQSLIVKNAANSSTTDYENASGTYIQTTDGKKFVVLPGIEVDGIENETIKEVMETNEVSNDSGILIEQTELTQGALNNYGTILLDTSFKTTGTQLDIYGNLNNYGTLDIGAAAVLNVQGDVNNYGTLTFRVQANPAETADISSSIQTGLLKVINGTITFDISPGSTNAFYVDIADWNTLSNLTVVDASTASSTNPTYTLVQTENGNINYTYTLGDYTTTFSKNDISTTKNNSTCNYTNCEETLSSGATTDTNQETYYTTNNGTNPWNMDKAATDENGGSIEKDIGDITNDGVLIEKPSQADKEKDEEGFGGIGATEAQRGYDYAQGKLESSFAITFLGASIDGKYLTVQKVVTDTLVGFNVIKRDLTDFIAGDSETALCNVNSSAFDCVLYIEAGGNNSWINALKQESANAYNILEYLFNNDQTSLVMLTQLDQTLAISRNIEYFQEVGRTLDTAFQYISDLSLKSQTLDTLVVEMDSARVNRLTRMAGSYGSSSEYLAYQAYQKSLAQALVIAEKMRFASANEENVNEIWFDTLADLVMRFNKREEYPNNLWINALGNVNFSSTGNSRLYGFNAGYDYFINTLQTAIGIYAGYGYGIFTGINNGYLSNRSNNIFAGFYTRTFIENHEYDVTINAASGFVNEELSSKVAGMPLLDMFSQQYDYNINNLEANLTYGYAFVLKKGYVIKPLIGVSYFLLSSTGFNRTTPAEVAGVFAVTTDDNYRQGINCNIGIEGRKYFANQSYVFLLGEFKQDVFLISNNVDSNKHTTASVGTLQSAGNSAAMQYAVDYKGQQYRSSVFVTGGGEYSFGRMYINGSLTFQSDVFEKNFDIGLNLGARVIF